MLGVVIALALTACGQSVSADNSASRHAEGSTARAGDPLKTITAAELAQTGVVLSPPTGLTSTISREQADAIAEKQDDSGPVIETEFFHCSRPDVGGFDGGCWAVSIKPPDGPQQVSAGPTSVPPVVVAYDLVLVNAANGRFIASFSGSEPPEATSGSSG